MSVIPIPKKQQHLLKSDKVNFSLYSPRMIVWEKNKKGEFKFDSDSMVRLEQKSRSCFKNADKLLKERNNKQAEYFKFLKEQKLNTFEFYVKLTSPFVTGLGSGHPTETGMILDRNTGVPYIPASSIKGVCLLAYAINIAKKGMADKKGNITLEGMKKIEELFGTQDENAKEKKRGQLVFLDAYPAAIPELAVDIMNPHFKSYYNGTNKQPVETESPEPIKFMTVKKDVGFTFRCYFLPLGEGKKESEKNDISEEVNAIFKTAFETVGFGGKTSIGYGRFKLIKMIKYNVLV